MCETLWEMLTVENINASATVVTALATVILMAITGFYACQTRKLVQVEAERSEFEAKRAELESRPYLQLRFFNWGGANESRGIS
jgi:hypothetical protein